MWRRQRAGRRWEIGHGHGAVLVPQIPLIIVFSGDIYSVLTEQIHGILYTEPIWMTAGEETEPDETFIQNMQVDWMEKPPDTIDHSLFR